MSKKILSLLVIAIGFISINHTKASNYISEPMYIVCCTGGNGEQCCDVVHTEPSDAKCCADQNGCDAGEGMVCEMGPG